ncbi:MAG: UvrB/UvrC motif-containing protein [Lentisphaeria bacterium]|nr:UvrB/UvrC motif-containing protein [Lentisphaeria bacterium]
MLCDICKKNEATIHYKEIVGGQQKSLNVCAECAQKHEKASGMNFGAFNLAEMLFNLGKHAGKPAEEPEISVPEPLTCKACGRTVRDLHDSGGRLGCAGCYTSFAPLLEDVLNRVQRGKVHVGKRPGAKRRNAGNAAVNAAKLAALRKELDTLIKVENYEKAAQVRDAIRELEKTAAKPASAKEGV